MPNGEHKPGEALADRMRERHERNRRNRSESASALFADWEEPTSPEIRVIRDTTPDPGPPSKRWRDRAGRKEVATISGAFVALAVALLTILQQLGYLPAANQQPSVHERPPPAQIQEPARREWRGRHDD